MEKQLQFDEKMIARNFFAINDFSKAENGNFKVSGLLSVFDSEEDNMNGYVYHAGCYNDFCKNYFEKNMKNIPLDILHNTMDIYHLAGKVTEFAVTNSEARIVAEVSRFTPLFENIVGLIEDEVLQGFSDMSFVNDGYFDGTKNLFHVKQCSIFSVTLTQNPAVAKSQLKAMNATKFNFENIKTETEEKKSTFFGL